MAADGTTHSSDAEDRQLLAGTAGADRAAFDRLYRRYEKRVHGYLNSMVRDSNAAEDLLIETMVAVWNSAAKFAGQSLVSTWILGIARHKALDVVRQRARRAPTVALDETDPIEEPAPGPAARAQQADTDREVRAALGALSAEHQEVLRLAFFEDLPYGEIAALLGIPVNTVKSRVFYAKEQLRVAMARGGSTGEAP
jgi:RNA polymerase sigma-70 factor (ECF subfamily)